MGISYIRMCVCLAALLCSIVIFASTSTKSDFVGKYENIHNPPDENLANFELDNDLQGMLQEIMDAQTLTRVMDQDFGGVSASVITADEEVFNVFTGIADFGVPMDGEILVGLSDVSQTVYATVALLLVEAGAISLDQTISDFIDVSTLANIPGSITIEQLLRHTSGLDNFSDADDYQATLFAEPSRLFTPEEIIELFVDEPEDPGSFSYSNTNFLVLGLVLEAANGPLTLQQTLDAFGATVGLGGLQIYPENGRDFNDDAVYFGDQMGDGMPFAIQRDGAIFTGASYAGNVFAAPENVVKLIAEIQDLVDQGVISEENARLLNDFTPISDRLSGQYGLGLELFNLEIDGVILPFVGHTGTINHRTALLYSQDAEVGVFVSTNNGLAAEEDVLELARQLLDVAIDGAQFSEGEAITLQFLHASDLEGGLEALDNAPNFAAIIEGLEAGNDNTIVLSSGDNYIPGPFFNAAGDRSLRDVIQEVHQEFFDEPGLTNLRETAGRIDISIMNFIGFDASAVGNHEFDAGPTAYRDIIATDIRGTELGDVRWLGAQFPYLSSNYDFSGEGSLDNCMYSYWIVLSGIATTSRRRRQIFLDQIQMVLLVTSNHASDLEGGLEAFFRVAI